MADLSVGLAAFTMEDPASGTAPRWDEIRRWALLSEETGFDTFWVADELVWENDDKGTVAGWWECVALLGALAEATSSIIVGSWVLSALHRNPGLTVKVAETLDEISGGRFLFGLGAGHAGRQGAIFGFPPDRTVSRYEEALAVIVPLLREGSVDYSGEYHSAERQENRPRGPRPNAIPLMLAGHGPRTIGLAVKDADIWSAYATTSSRPEAFAELMDLVYRTCEEQGRDPSSLGRSVGIGAVAPGREPGSFWPDPVSGSPDEIAASLLQFHEMGFTSVELCLDDDPAVAIPLFSDVLELVRDA
ncbi:MAG: LLM class flavin-dependent oxidoreductase [Acidimicrobiia bacterium]